MMKIIENDKGAPWILRSAASILSLEDRISDLATLRQSGKSERRSVPHISPGPPIGMLPR